MLAQPLYAAAEMLELEQMASTSPSTENGATKEVLIHFHADILDAERDAYIQMISGQLLLWIEQIHVAKVQVPVSYMGDDTLIGGAAGDVLVETVEEDGIVKGVAEPNDPDLYDEQKVYAASLLGLFDAWDYTTGSSDVVVAVLDTGIASAHPEFTGRILEGYDYYNNDNDPEDDHGHGTHVAGTVAAAINNGIGSAGLCGGCSILPVKVLNQNNAGTWSGVASGIIFAADNNADIIVMSLGSTSGTQVVEDAINYAMSKDVLVIAAAGNANSNRNFYPAAYEGVVGVGATNRDDERWVLSNYGEYVDVSAPGHVIYSTYFDLNNSYDGHVFMSGTSMATPHVGGLAGLLKSRDPSLTNTEIAQIMMDSALDLGEPGKDDYFGMGRIDPVAALKLVSPVVQASTLSGIAWEDTDADGVMDDDETGRIAGAVIKLYSSNNKFVASTSADDDGEWQFQALAAGSYYIMAEESTTELIWTNPQFADVSLVEAHNYTNKLVGFVKHLPEDVVTDINASRTGDTVTISWKITSDLVTGLRVERAIGDEEYETIREINLTLAGTSRSSESFADTLPAGTGDAAVSYRMQITPGDTYLGAVEAEPSTGSTTLPGPGNGTTQPPPSSSSTVFLPWASAP